VEVEISVSLKAIGGKRRTCGPPMASRESRDIAARHPQILARLAVGGALVVVTVITNLSAASRTVRWVLTPSSSGRA